MIAALTFCKASSDDKDCKLASKLWVECVCLGMAHGVMHLLLLPVTLLFSICLCFCHADWIQIHQVVLNSTG